VHYAAATQIVATQRDAEQEAHTSHDPITVADAGAPLDEVQLEALHLIGRRGIGRAFDTGLWDEGSWVRIPPLRPFISLEYRR